MVSAGQKWRIRLISLVVFALIWEIAGRVSRSLLLPTFSETVIGFGALMTQAELWRALWISNQALVVGYGLALLIGVPLGVLSGSIRALERIAAPYLTLILTVPIASLIPIVILAVGLNLWARALVVFLFAFPFVVINTQAGAREVDRGLIEMARAFCATRWQSLWQVALPAMAPGMMLGARIGLGRAISGMVLIELLLMAVGIGQLILLYRGRFQAGSLYAVVLIVLIEAVVLTRLAARLERILIPWATSKA